MKYVIPKGFRLFSVKSGISTKNKRDLGVIISDSKCSYYGTFTKNLFSAAPVKYCKNLLGKKIDGLIVNSGCANACTGDQGYTDILEVMKYFKRYFNKTNNVLMSSTGVIGHRLPLDKIRSGIDKIYKEKLLNKKNSDLDIENFENAIMTTDTKMKIYSKEIKFKDKNFNILSFAKGSGMIHPDMATMLCFILTDVMVPGSILKDILKKVTDKTFNCISVDGDTSTNDSVILLSSGLSNYKINHNNKEILYNIIYDCCLSLSKAIARDGEGATKLIKIEIEGLSNENSKKIAQTIAVSPLVKTAIYGRDINWGRIVASIGHAGVLLNTSKIKVYIQDELVFTNNMPVCFDEEILSEKMANKEIEIKIVYGTGKNIFNYYTCDLTEEYIKINALYRT